MLATFPHRYLTRPRFSFKYFGRSRRVTAGPNVRCPLRIASQTRYDLSLVVRPVIGSNYINSRDFTDYNIVDDLLYNLKSITLKPISK